MAFVTMQDNAGVGIIPIGLLAPVILFRKASIKALADLKDMLDRASHTASHDWQTLHYLSQTLQGKEQEFTQAALKTVGLKYPYELKIGNPYHDHILAVRAAMRDWTERLENLSTVRNGGTWKKFDAPNMPEDWGPSIPKSAADAVDEIVEKTKDIKNKLGGKVKEFGELPTSMILGGAVAVLALVLILKR
jgi:hypothetical protein